MTHAAHLRPQTTARTISILGSTGTIGQNTLKLIDAHPERFAVQTLAAGDNAALLAEQAKRFRARRAVIANEASYPTLKAALSGSGIEAADQDVDGAIGPLCALPTGFGLRARDHAAARPLADAGEAAAGERQGQQRI